MEWFYVLAGGVGAIAGYWLGWHVGRRHGDDSRRDEWTQQMDELLLLRDRMEAIKKLSEPVTWEE